MSLSSTTHIKSQLTTNLAAKAPVYFESLQKFITGRISRTEFDDTLKPILDAPYLIQLHNALIISLFDARSHKRPLTPPGGSSNSQDPNSKQAGGRPRKRRRVVPYQGPGDEADDDPLGAARLRRWIVSLGKAERERIRTLVGVAPVIPPQTLPQNSPQNAPQSPFHPPPYPTTAITTATATSDPNSIPVSVPYKRPGGPFHLPKERADPPGIRATVSLSTHTRLSPTIQHITERVNLICAQHNLQSPQAPNPNPNNSSSNNNSNNMRAVATLIHLACEVKLKQLITHALTLTTKGLVVKSIETAEDKERTKSLTGSPQKQQILSIAAFETLFTLAPADLPNKSAAAIKLAALGDLDRGDVGREEHAADGEDDLNELIPLPPNGIRDRDKRWQLAALLAQRSAVKEALMGKGMGLNLSLKGAGAGTLGTGMR